MLNLHIRAVGEGTFALFSVCISSLNLSIYFADILCDLQKIEVAQHKLLILTIVYVDVSLPSSPVSAWKPTNLALR